MLNIDMKKTKILFLSGVTAIIFAWIIIFLCWFLNPWFVFTKHAFSDFGSQKAYYPWLYNVGLIITGMLLIVFSYALYILSEHKLEVVGASYIALSGVFLALIGIFPAGTYPHAFVSLWFFIQFDIAMIFFGGGMLRLSKKYAKQIFWLAILEGPIAVIIDKIWGWPSAAVIETYGVIIIDICVILITLSYYEALQRKNKAHT